MDMDQDEKLYQIDLSTDTFLNPDYFQRFKNQIVNIVENIRVSKSKMKQAAKAFRYVKTFKTKGVQGVAGILEKREQPVKKGQNPIVNPNIVFKISLDIDKAIEHEYLVTQRLNILRDVCPNFMASYSLITLPISNSFVSENSIDSDDEEGCSDSECSCHRESYNEDSSGEEYMSDEDTEEKQIEPTDLFQSTNDYLPTSMVLLEYVSDISLYHVCKYGDRNQILSQILMILLALQISQNKCNFTHYDLHMDNILIRKVEEDSFFIYIINNQLYCIPTYGNFPVMIDMGSSYIDDIDGKIMCTTIANYNNGLQPTLFDTLNDIHHLLLSIFYYIEDQSKEFDVLCGRILYYFQSVPILKKRGWKQLPVNLIDNFFDYIFSINPSLEKNKIVKDYDIELIDLLGYSVRLPWAPIKDKSKEEIDTDFLKNFDIILREFEKIDEIDLVHEFDTLFIMRELITIIDNYREKVLSGNKTVFKDIERELRNNVAFLVSKKDFPNLNFVELINAIINFSDHLSSFFYYNVKENVEVINECYLNSQLRSPLAFYKKIRQNVALRNNFNPDSVLYVMDSDTNSRKRLLAKELFNMNELNQLNDLTSVQQENVLYQRYKC